jgi:hypothetical protein
MRFVHGARSSGSGLVHGSKRAPDYQLGERGGYLAVGLQVGLDVLLHGERDVRVADPLAQRLPVDLGIAARGCVAVAHVVQVDLRQPGRRGELLEPPRDRIRVRRPAVLPAEQHAVIVVVRAELALLLIDCLDVRLEDGQRERIKAAPGGAAGPASAPALCPGGPRGARRAAFAQGPGLAGSSVSRLARCSLTLTWASITQLATAGLKAPSRRRSPIGYRQPSTTTGPSTARKVPAGPSGRKGQLD